MKSQKPFTLLKRPPQGVYYYKLPGEKTRHSTGLTVKTQAERYVVGILKGEIQQSRSQRLGEFTEHLFISTTARLYPQTWCGERGKTFTV